MRIITENHRPPPQLLQQPHQVEKGIEVFYFVQALHEDKIIVFDWNDNVWDRQPPQHHMMRPDTIYIPVDPVTAIVKKMVTPAEIGVSDAVLATVGLLTKG